MGAKKLKLKQYASDTNKEIKDNYNPILKRDIFVNGKL
jgi:hypothetical protein